MKKVFFLFVFFVSAFAVFAQRLTTVGILPFEVSGEGVSAGEAEEATRLVMGELRSWGTLSILPESEARNGEYLVRGQISRQDGRVTLTATTYEARTGKTLNGAKEEASSLIAISLVSFCSQAVENVPYPNYLLGKWRSTINMIDGPVTCVMEFRTDRSVRVEQFDTWEHSGTNSLKYQAIGSGTYSYAGYLRRTLTVGNRQIQVDATAGINLTLEDALPKYKLVSAGGLRLLFNDSRDSFEIVSGGIPCGDNKSGARVYPSARVYYTQFTKIE